MPQCVFQLFLFSHHRSLNMPICSFLPFTQPFIWKAPSPALLLRKNHRHPGPLSCPKIRKVQKVMFLKVNPINGHCLNLKNYKTNKILAAFLRVAQVHQTLHIRVTSRITLTKFTNTTSCSPYFMTFLLYKCTKIFHPLHSGFIPTLAKLYAKM